MKKKNYRTIDNSRAFARREVRKRK